VAAPIRARAVVSWIVYDLANTIFSMGVLSMYFSLLVRDQVGTERADSAYALITAVSMGLIFLISPLLGAMTDRARRRMPFLIWSTLACCAATALLGQGPYAMSALLFIFANAAYQAGVQYYDALLPEVTTEANRGRIGGIGVGIGYLGSYVAVGLGIAFGTANKPLLFQIIAGAFLLLSIPCFLFVTERGNPAPRRVFGWEMIRESTAQTLRTLREGERYPGLLRFLLGRAFYTDAINTVISYMTLYVVNVAVASGLTQAKGESEARLIMMSAITCAVVGGFVWGWIVDRIGPKATLTVVLELWFVFFTLAAAIGFLRLPIGWMYLAASMAGVAMGGTWAADRPLMLRLTPPDRVGEFYGLYGMVGRFSAVTGPLLWGATTYLTIERGGMAVLTGEAIAIVSLLGMIIASALILRPVSDEKRPVYSHS
jgi:UMF1 family MFS transporter